MAYDLLYIFIPMSPYQMSLYLKHNFVSISPLLSGERKDEYLNFLLVCCTCKCLRRSAVHLPTTPQAPTSGAEKAPPWGDRCPQQQARGGRRAGEPKHQLSQHSAARSCAKWHQVEEEQEEEEEEKEACQLAGLRSGQEGR